MKRLFPIALLTLLLSCFSARSQHALKAFYAQHKADLNTEYISIPKLLLWFCADDPELRKAFKHMKSLQVFVAESNQHQMEGLRMELNQALQQDGFGDLIQITEEGENVRIFVREEAAKIRSVLIMVDSPEELVVLHTHTNITYEQLAEMLNNVQNGKGSGGWGSIVTSGKG